MEKDSKEEVVKSPKTETEKIEAEVEKGEIKKYQRTIKINIEEFLATDSSFKIPEHLLHRFSIAPMFDVTNVHFRFIMRLLTRCSTLWTEMYNSNTIAYNPVNREKSLKMNEIEHPVCCQLGGMIQKSYQKLLNLLRKLDLMKSISIVVVPPQE